MMRGLVLKKIVGNYLLGWKIWNHFTFLWFLLFHLHKILKNIYPFLLCKSPYLLVYSTYTLFINIGGISTTRTNRILFNFWFNALNFFIFEFSRVSGLQALLPPYGCCLSGEEILTIWLVESKTLSARPSHYKAMDGFQNAYMVALFGSFGAKSLSGWGKLVCNVYGNPNSPRVDNLFFLNCSNSIICIFEWTSTLSSQGEFVQGPLHPMAVV